MTKTKWPPTPEKLKEKIDEYFDSLSSLEFPDYAGMLLYLGLFQDEVDDICNGDDATAAKYRRVFDYAALKRESWLSRVAASDSKLASGAFNLLKQQKNGGYTSASAPNKGSTLRLIVDGVGGMDAFK